MRSTTVIGNFDFDKVLPRVLTPSRLVSTPPEAENLRVCVHELVTGNGGLPSGLPYRADILRKYFYERVFGDSRGPHPFYGDEGKNMTEAGGRFISLETLRDQILKDIEDLVQYMISPAGEGMRSEGAARKSTTPTNDNEPAFSDQLAVVESRNSHRSHLKSPTGASSTVEMPIDQRRNVRPQSSNDEGILRKSQMDLLRNAGHNRAQVQGTFLDPSLHKKSEQGLSAFHQGGVAPSITTQGIVGDMNLPPAAIQPFGYGVASQSQFAAYPNQMLVGSSVYPFHMPLQQQWAYQQPPYIASQPAPYGPPLQPAYVQPGYSVYGQQPPMTDRPDYGPLPIPSHRPYARPPAANRVARIYAQTTAWQAPENAQVHGNFGAPTRATEWQNRFSPQPNVVPDLPSLPYRAGSDVMYPKSTGGSSIRFQNITRDTPPNIDVVAAEENIPFMETAKLTKPSEWGVLKIANVRERR